MAIIQMDGFDTYPAGIALATHPLGMPSNGWELGTTTFAIFSTVLEGAGRHLHIQLGTNHAINFGCSFAPRVGVIVGFRFRVQAWSSAAWNISFIGGGQHRATANIGQTWTTFAGIGGSFPIVIGQWYHIEIAYLSTGGIMWIDGAERLRSSASLPVVDNITFSFTTSDWGSPSLMIQVDDLYILDTTGTFANTRLGPQARIQFVTPSASGQHTGWTFTGASGWQSANTFDAHHVIGTASGSRITTPLTDLESAGALHVQAARLMDVSQNSHFNPLRTVRQVIMNGATPVSVGVDDQPPAMTWRRKRTWVNVNPVTGLQWTGSDINAAEIGLEVV